MLLLREIIEPASLRACEPLKVLETQDITSVESVTSKRLIRNKVNISVPPAFADLQKMDRNWFTKKGKVYLL